MSHLIFVLGLLLSVQTAVFHISPLTPVQQLNPAYAKWGMLAVKETKQKYPNAHLIDYLHIGSEIRDDTTIEMFKLWLKDDNHEFGVFVNITFTTKTGELTNIDFKETDR